jgi:hypothetical protein
VSIRFKFLAGDVNWQTYGGQFVSKRLCNGYDGKDAVKGEDYDFHYWLVMDVRPNEDWEYGDKKRSKYYVTLAVVSPEAADPKELDAAARSWGYDDADILKAQPDPLFLVECLHSYGVAAYVWQEEGNNLSALMKEARKQAQLVNMMFGFYMDAPQNKIGSTGWDTVKGDLWAGLRRYEDDED